MGVLVTCAKQHVTISGAMKFHGPHNTWHQKQIGKTLAIIGLSCKKMLFMDPVRDGNQQLFHIKEKKVSITTKKKTTYISLVA